MKRMIGVALSLCLAVPMAVAVAPSGSASAQCTNPAPTIAVADRRVPASNLVQAFGLGDGNLKVLWNSVSGARTYYLSMYKITGDVACPTWTLTASWLSNGQQSIITAEPGSYMIYVQALSRSGRTGNWASDLAMNSLPPSVHWWCAAPLALARSISSASDYVLSRLSALPGRAGRLARDGRYALGLVEVATGAKTLDEFVATHAGETMVNVALEFVDRRGVLTLLNVSMQLKDAVDLVNNARAAGQEIGAECTW